MYIPILPDGRRVGGVSVWLEVIEDVGIVVKFVVDDDDNVWSVIVEAIFELEDDEDKFSVDVDTNVFIVVKVVAVVKIITYVDEVTRVYD